MNVSKRTSIQFLVFLSFFFFGLNFNETKISKIYSRKRKLKKSLLILMFFFKLNSRLCSIVSWCLRRQHFFSLSLKFYLTFFRVFLWMRFLYREEEKEIRNPRKWLTRIGTDLDHCLGCRVLRRERKNDGDGGKEIAWKIAIHNVRG